MSENDTRQSAPQISEFALYLSRLYVSGGWRGFAERIERLHVAARLARGVLSTMREQDFAAFTLDGIAETMDANEAAVIAMYDATIAEIDAALAECGGAVTEPANG